MARRTVEERREALFSRLQASAYRREQRESSERLATLRERDRAELRAAPREQREQVAKLIERRERERQARAEIKLGTRPVQLPSENAAGWSRGVKFGGADEAGYIAVMPGQAPLSEAARMAARDWCPKVGEAVFQSRKGGKVWWEVVEPSQANRWVSYLMEREPDGTMRVLGMTPMSRNRVESIENAADLGTLDGYGAKAGGERFILCVPLSVPE